MPEMNANCAIFQAAKYTKMHFKVKIMIHPARTFSLNILTVEKISAARQRQSLLAQ